MDILTIVLVELLVIVVAALLATKFDAQWLLWTVGLLMVVIFTTARILIDYGIGVSNAGNLLFGGVYLLLAIIYHRYGIETAQRAIYKALYALIVVLVLRSVVVLHIDNSPTDSWILLAYKQVIVHADMTLAGVFFAFYLSSNVLLGLMSHPKLPFMKKPLPRPAAYLVGVAIGQMIDSALFFYVVFGLDSNMWQYMLVGYAVKIGFAVATLPLFGLLIPSSKQEVIAA